MDGQESTPTTPATPPREGLVRALRDAESSTLKHQALARRLAKFVRRVREENLMPGHMRAEALDLERQAQAAEQGAPVEDNALAEARIRLTQLTNLTRRQSKFIESLRDSKLVPPHMRGEATDMRREASRLTM